MIAVRAGHRGVQAGLREVAGAAAPGDAALDQVESSLSKKLQEKTAKDRLAAGADDQAPADYQQQVDSYFKALATRKNHDPRCISPLRCHGGSALLVAGGIAGIALPVPTGARSCRCRRCSAAC